MISSLDWNARFTPPLESFEKPKYEYALEGLRGIAALNVCYSHIALGRPENLDVGYQLGGIFNHFYADRDSVLIFFLLSGYVIGLTNVEKFSKTGTIQYLIRRGIRLLPMYFFAILLSVLASSKDSLGTIISNLFFLQNVISPSLAANGALWSLNYEVIYYLAFPLVLYFRPKVLNLLLGTFILVCVGWVIHPFPQIISGYLAGWLFWLMGLWLAWKVPHRAHQISVPLVSYFLLFLATGEFHLGAVILGALKLGNPNPNYVSLQNLTSLPICIALVATVANRPSKLNRWLHIIAFAIPLTAVAYAFIFKSGVKSESWAVGTFEVVAAIALLWWRIKPDILKNLAFFGSISYGLYVLHMPITVIVRNNFPSMISGNLGSFLIRLVIWSLLTIALAYLLEIKIQPIIKKWSKEHILSRFANLFT